MSEKRVLVFMSCHQLQTTSLPDPLLPVYAYSPTEFFSRDQLQEDNWQTFKACQQEGSFRRAEKYRAFLQRACTIVVARNAEGDFVSSALLLPTGSITHPGFEAQLEYVMTYPARRHIGGAQSVVGGVLQAAKQLGLHCVHLICDPRLEGMYRKLGFRAMTRYPIPS